MSAYHRKDIRASFKQSSNVQIKMYVISTLLTFHTHIIQIKKFLINILHLCILRCFVLQEYLLNTNINDDSIKFMNQQQKTTLEPHMFIYSFLFLSSQIFIYDRSLIACFFILKIINWNSKRVVITFDKCFIYLVTQKYVCGILFDQISVSSISKSCQIVRSITNFLEN